jgi:transcriptional regulator with XRE-family HTH domain
METPEGTRFYDIGKRLRELRESLDLSQKEVGDLLEMRESAVSRIETGKVNPTWRTIERFLGAMDQDPCALFPDLCRANSTEPTFRVAYHDRKPLDPTDAEPHEILDVPVHGPVGRLLGVPPIDDRFILARGNDDAMIPIYYPGDLLLIDSKRKAQPGKIIVGFHKGEGMVRRLVHEKKDLILTASNRRYPPQSFVWADWIHYGVLVWAFHATLSRYAGASDID